ncbi:hypothetical protein [Amycolatopsis sp. lyj-23]|uniref:hypothetical protein n=1 Tax=Amycolatopsis sp. lyj-23 TaxID=2789283 RepID=UPI00397C03F0
MAKQVPDGFPFADRVAQVYDGDRFAGHLLVTVPELVRTRRNRGITYVDMDFARPDPEEPDGLRYEDRADPGTESARQELEAGELDWYGEKFTLRWLAPEPAARVRRELFGRSG